MLSGLEKTFLDHQKKTLIFYGVAAVLIIALGIYGYLYYQNSQEQKISLVINTIIEKQELANRVPLSDQDNLLITNQLKAVATEYYSLYEKYPNNVGGLRALFLSANINFNLKKSKKAKEQYQLLFDTDKKHFLAPESVYHLVVIKENTEQYADAIKLADEFLLLYPTHYLKGELLLSQGRNYYFSKDSAKAKKNFEDILVNTELTAVYPAAEEWLDLIRLDATLKN